ncbi:MAG: PIN domain-containing protein [Akkermansiaceae bacterium]
MKNWAFVDYENVGTLESLDFNDYERLFVFCGPRHKRLSLGEIPTDTFSHLEIIRMDTTGKNNLDFHLTFYMGIQHQVAPRNVEFHVVSNDTGFHGLIAHLVKIGRGCKAIGRPGNPKKKAAKKAVKKTAKKTAKKVAKKAAKKAAKKTAKKGYVAADIHKMLMKHQERSRPRSKSALVKWVANQTNAGEKQAEALCLSLMNNQFVEEVENTLRFLGEE